MNFWKFDFRTVFRVVSGWMLQKVLFTSGHITFYTICDMQFCAMTTSVRQICAASLHERSDPLNSAKEWCMHNVAVKVPTLRLQQAMPRCRGRQQWQVPVVCGLHGRAVSLQGTAEPASRQRRSNNVTGARITHRPLTSVIVSEGKSQPDP